ncbi:hypothetical protein LINGRAHAP2_LOCUS37067 [Linum grandiflorum]
MATAQVRVKVTKLITNSTFSAVDFWAPSIASTPLWREAPSIASTHLWIFGVRFLLDKIKGFTLFAGLRRHPLDTWLAKRHLSSPEKVIDYLSKCGVPVNSVTMVMPKRTSTVYNEDCDHTLQTYAKYSQHPVARDILEDYCGIAIEE